jgi:hypothetical protein
MIIRQIKIEDAKKDICYLIRNYKNQIFVSDFKRPQIGGLYVWNPVDNERNHESRIKEIWEMILD